MARIAEVLFLWVCLFDISYQACNDCECCHGESACDADKKCTNGCQPGYWGDKCTESCSEHCKTCESNINCTECHPGYYGKQCAFKCGKGCINNTCLQSGECSCKSSNFWGRYCSSCSRLNMYGDECNYTCPPNCELCNSQTNCRSCTDDTFYGSYCQFKCAVGCVYGICDKNGRCHLECNSGYTGEKCDSCVRGLYGPNCDVGCPSNCRSCLNLTYCTKCRQGFFGKICTNVCSTGCHGVCSIADGKCYECKQGYLGDFCNNTKTCVDGFYGYNCSKPCTHYDFYCLECLTNALGFYAGCVNCISGYYPQFSFGLNQSICTHCPSGCKNESCNSKGICSYGCSLGKWGNTCKSNCTLNCLECNQIDGQCFRCINGEFSKDCSKVCSSNCSSTNSEKICEIHTGNCINGCSLYGKYGNHCEHQCSETCTNQTCNWKTGYCSYGCVENYHGLFCENKCASTCKLVDKKSTCNDSNGYCISGCENGFHGGMCSGKCNEKCTNKSCDQFTAECLYGCIEGYAGLQCTQVLTQTLQESITTGEVVGIVLGSVMICGLIGGALTLVFIMWKRRNARKKEESGEQTDGNFENNFSVRYED